MVPNSLFSKYFQVVCLFWISETLMDDTILASNYCQVRTSLFPEDLAWGWIMYSVHLQHNYKAEHRACIALLALCLNSGTLTRATRVEEAALQFFPQFTSLLKISHTSILTPAAPPMLVCVGGLAFLVQEHLDPLYSVCSAPLNIFALNQSNIWQRVVCCERYPVHLGLISPHFMRIMMLFLPPRFPLFLKTAEQEGPEVPCEETKNNESSGLLRKSAVIEPGSVLLYCPIYCNKTLLKLKQLSSFSGRWCVEINVLQIIFITIFTYVILVFI